jgi:hypothetical protein
MDPYMVLSGLFSAEQEGRCHHLYNLAYFVV